MRMGFAGYCCAKAPSGKDSSTKSQNFFTLPPSYGYRGAAMRHLPAHFPAVQDRDNPDHKFLVKLIPFVGPGAALFFLFVVYWIFALVFTK
jgi:hypothetical protein